MVLLVLISIVLVLVLLKPLVSHLKMRHGRYARLIDQIPGPKGLPIIGSVLMFQVSSEELWHLTRRLSKEHYPIFRIWTHLEAELNIMHPDDAQVLLSSMKHIDKGMIYYFLHPWLGTGLLTSAGAKWHARRKILTNSFHFHVLQEFAPVFVEQSRALTDTLRAHNGPVVMDLVPLLTQYTLKSICETAMGTNITGMNDFLTKYRRAVYDIGEILLYRLIRPWVHPDWAFNLSPKGRAQNHVLKDLHGFTDKIIDERKSYHEKNDWKFLKELPTDNSSEDAQQERKTSEDDIGVKKRRRMAMLDLLIAAWRDGKRIDDRGIREEVDTFMFEGHDTTAMGLCFLLMCLAENEEIQGRCREEVDRVFDAAGAKIDIVQLQQLAYVERCIKESLRLYPSVPFISRHLHEDLQLKHYLVPRGTSAHLHIYDLHRDPNFWPDPETFDPDRFLPEAAAGRHPFAYIPFSGGPRNCIGQRFAMLELKALVAHVLRHFHLQPVDKLEDVVFLSDLVLRPKNPLRMKFVPRM